MSTQTMLRKNPLTRIPYVSIHKYLYVLLDPSQMGSAMIPVMVGWFTWFFRKKKLSWPDQILQLWISYVPDTAQHIDKADLRLLLLLLLEEVVDITRKNNNILER